MPQQGGGAAVSTELDTLRQRVAIEARMEHCRDAAASNLVEIGTLLNQAKDGGLVPRGEWTAWVQEHAGMNERTAQRVMRIARELPAGSPLASLGVAKLSALLTLPEGEREDAAREMDAEHLSSREVEERVRAIRQERDEAVQKARAEAAKAAEERASARYAERLAAARSRIDALEARIADARAEGKADAVQEMGDKLAAQKREYDRLHEQAMAQARELADVKSQLLDAQRSKPDEEALIRMTVLKDEAEKRCAEAEREIDRLCEQLDEQSTQLLRAGSGAAGGKPSPATRILSAIGALMAEAGNAPAELARMGGMDADTAQLLAGQAQLVGQWAMSIIAACGGETHA